MVAAALPFLFARDEEATGGLGCSGSATVFCRFDFLEEDGFSGSGSGTGLASRGGGFFRLREVDGGRAGVPAGGMAGFPEFGSELPACSAEARVILDELRGLSFVDEGGDGGKCVLVR